MEFFLKMADKIMQAFFASKKGITPSFAKKSNARVEPADNGWLLTFSDGREPMALEDGDVLLNDGGKLTVIKRNSPELAEYSIWNEEGNELIMNLKEFIDVVDTPQTEDWAVEAS